MAERRPYEVRAIDAYRFAAMDKFGNVRAKFVNESDAERFCRDLNELQRAVAEDAAVKRNV